MNVPGQTKLKEVPTATEFEENIKELSKEVNDDKVSEERKLEEGAATKEQENVNF